MAIGGSLNRKPGIQVPVKALIVRQLAGSQVAAAIQLFLLLLVLPGIGLAQNSVPFTYQIGGATPASQGYYITDNSTTALALTLSTGGAAWDSASLNTTTTTSATPAILTISVNPAGLAAGTYYDTVTVSSSQGSLIFDVSLQVTGVAGPLTLSSSAFTFNAVAAGTAPASQTLTVTAQSSTSGTAAASEQSCASSNWLSVSPAGSFTASQSNTSFTISVSQSGIAAGTVCSGTISLTTSAGTQAATVTLNVTTAAAGALTLSSSAFTFNGLAGGTAPASQTLTVTAQSSTSGTAATSEQSCASSSWLTLSPTGNFTASQSNYTFTISVSQSGIAGGTVCSGTISLNTASGTQTATVTLNVTTASTGALTLSASAFTFNAVAGGTAPASQTLTVTAQSSVAATASSSQQSCTGSSWLTLSPTGSFTASQSNSSFTITVSQSGIAAGTVCSGTISLTTSAGTQTATVTLNVTVASTGTLILSPASLTFSGVAGGTAPASQILTVTAQSNTSATASSSEQSCTGSTWLTLSPTGSFTASQTNSSFAVSASQSGFPAGTECTGTISMTTATGTQTVPVTLYVTIPVSTLGQLTFSTTGFSFNAVAGGAAPGSQTLTVTAQSTISATLTVTEQSCTSSNWLTVSPSSAFTASQTGTIFTISVSQSGIAAGTLCNGTISMTANSITQTVGVTMVVSNTGSLTVNPPGPLSFSSTIGGSNPGAQNVVVSNEQGSAGIGFTVTTSASWITTNAGGNSVATPYTLQVSVNPSGFTESSTAYYGTVTITPTGGTPIVINVSLAVAAVPVVSATPTTLAFNYSAGGSAPPSQMVQISGGGAASTFSVSTSSSGWLQVPAICTTVAPCTTPNAGTFGLTVAVTPTGLNAGTYNGTITVSGTGQPTGTTTISVSFTIVAPVPAITLITNAASFVTGPVSPGEMISIFASASTPIGPATAVSLSATTCPTPCTNVPTSMAGVQVIFQPGGVAAPLIYVSATQINCLVPYAVLGATTLQAQVNYLGQASNAYPLQFAETQPGIFTALATGTGLAIAQQYDAQGNYQGQNSSSNPAGVGWYLVFYVTGEGIIPSPAITGQVTSSANVIPLLGPPTVLIDNQPSTVPYFGEADGFVSGLMQVNAIVPAGVHTGQAVSLSLTMDGNSSQYGIIIYTK